MTTDTSPEPTVPEDLCPCEGDRFMVTITADDGETRESGPTMLCCANHLVAAKVVANDLVEREPTMSIHFDIRPVPVV